MIIANCPLLRYSAVPFVFGGRIFNSAPPGRRANSELVEPFTKVDVITGVVKLSMNRLQAVYANVLRLYHSAIVNVADFGRVCVLSWPLLCVEE